MATVSKVVKEEGEIEEEDTREENRGEEDMAVVDNYMESKSHLRSISNQVSSAVESVIDSESDPVLQNIGKLLLLLKEYGVYQVHVHVHHSLSLSLSLLSLSPFLSHYLSFPSPRSLKIKMMDNSKSFSLSQTLL